MSLSAFTRPLARRLLPSPGSRYLELEAFVKAARNTAHVVHWPGSVVRAWTAPRRRVLCRPSTIRSHMVMAKIFAINGYRPVFDPDRPHDFSMRLPSPSGRPILNARWTSNQKARVAEAWAASASYDLAVDPVTYEGPMVEKSDANATHDGRVVNGPLRPSELVAGKVYQRLIDNSDGDEVIDLRAPLYAGRIPFVYAKRRPIHDRFSNKNSSVEIRETSEVFSEAEQGVLARYAWEAGLDYGEADVLRDNASGLIYVVDSTQGPSGPPNGLPPGQAREALLRLAAAFDRVVENAIRGRAFAGDGAS